jgi:hypothetical protein
MTVEERFERITAGLVEQFRGDREENRQLWRDTKRHINDLAQKIADTNDAVARLADESREADKRFEQKIDRLAEESRAADQQLRERIESRVVAIGKI